MNAAALEKPPAAVASKPQKVGVAVAAVSKHDLPAVLTVDQVDRLTVHFRHANAMLTMLIHMFTGESSVEVQASDTRDIIMGVMQHADHILAAAHLEITDIPGVLPEDLRWRTYEARCIVALLERVEFDRGFSLDTFGSEFMADYLSASLACVGQALAGLLQHWEQQQ